MNSSLIQRLIESKMINPEKGNKVSPWVERKISNELRSEVISATSFLLESVGLSDRINTLLLGITECPTCVVCGKPTSYYRSTKNYGETCSYECQAKNPNVIQKKKETMLERYGVEHNIHLVSKDELTERGKRGYLVQKKNLEKRGYNNIMDLPGVKEKHKEAINKEGIQESRIQSLSDNFGSWEEYQRHRRKCMQIGEFGTYDKDEYADYSKQVWFYTNLNDLTLLENYDKRGRLDLKKDAYHLDHNISMLFGFKNNVHPSIIGNMCNLQMVEAKENIKKSDSCHMTLGELFARILMS